MNDGWLDLVEILESRDCLDDDGPRLLLCQKLVLFQIEVEVVTLTVAQHCTKPSVTDRQTHNPVSNITLTVAKHRTETNKQTAQQTDRHHCVTQPCQ